MKKYLLFFTLVVLCAIKLTAMEENTAKINTDDRVSVENLIYKFTEIWNTNRGNGLKELYWSDARFNNIYAMQFYGNDEIERRHVDIINSFLKDSQFFELTFILQKLSSEVVVAHVTWRLTNFREPQANNQKPGIVRTGLMTHTFVKKDSVWKISVSQNTLGPLPK
jgi:uncharacterized protein (TIGR02246 family)